MTSSVKSETLDECCLTEYHPLPGTPRGQIIKIAEINTYHVIGADSNSKSKAIVLLTDVFGMFSYLFINYCCALSISIGLTKNPRITADELSDKSGFDVYIPDLFNGDAIPSKYLADIPQNPGEKMSIGTKVSYRH